jgi:hypothetical protein
MKNKGFNYPEEINFSFRTLLENRKDDFLYLWTKKKQAGLLAIAGITFGSLISLLWPVTYSAKMTFVVENSKAGAGSLVSDLAGQFGLDVSSLNGISGVLAGENVQELLKSNKILKRSLLSTYDQKHTLADLYIRKYGLKKRWEDKYVENGELIFPADRQSYSRLQDSLLMEIVKRITEKEISIVMPDKRQGFFELALTTRDEQLSSLLCRQIVYESSNFYIQTKTQRIKNNIDRLQARADSIGFLLKNKTYKASNSSALLLDINPSYSKARVGAEVDERDKYILSTIYSEIIKNLEISKTILAQETPTVQVLDEPDFPLQKNSLKWYKSGFYGGLIFSFCYFFYILFVKPFKKNN